MTRVAHWLGVAVQSLVIGTLLALACLQLVAMAGGTAVFRYQGF